ncbi:MAG: hypothetical protein IT355_10035 [Gemmatimonadaceae bacterium]|nr:hypothetical protein [Gemmatimonadaceae bacterium]
MQIHRTLPGRAVWPFLLLVIAGCDAGPVEAPSDNDALAAQVEALSPASQVADAYAEAALPPSIVVRDAAGLPLTSVSVRFTSVGAAGDSLTQVRRTDGDGRATMPSWRLSIPSMYRTVVRAGNTAGLTFTALAVPQFLRDSSMRQRCPLSDSLRVPFAHLDSTLARLRSGRPLTIVAYGSSSTAGEGASRPGLGYVEQTAAQLRRAFPDASITMVNAGLTGAKAPDMDARLESAVLSHAPQLVLLQSATIEAIRGMPIDSLRLPLRRMLTRLRGRGIDVILLDSQRYRGFGGGSVYREFQSVLRAEGADVGVSTARRFLWYDEMLDRQVYTYDQLLSSDYLHPTDLGHECTATLVSTGIVGAMLGTAAP